MILFLYNIVFLGVVAFSAPVFAQQQINNNGANGGQLQQQRGGESILQNGGAQTASDITQNAGLQALQGIPNKPLVVTGAPSTTNTSTETGNDTRWVLLALLLFATLIGPALVYLRAMQVAEQEAADEGAAKTASTAAEDAKTRVVEKEATVSKQATTASKKPKKSSKKAKRKKSKR